MVEQGMIARRASSWPLPNGAFAADGGPVRSWGHRG